MVNYLSLLIDISLLLFICVLGNKNKMGFYHFSAIYNKRSEISNNYNLKLAGVPTISYSDFKGLLMQKVISLIRDQDRDFVKFRFKTPRVFAHSCPRYSTLTTNLDPHWVSGFVDAEGCFKITVRKQLGSTGWGVSASFSLNLHAKDLPLLSKIKSFFSVGRIHIASGEKSASFRVEKIKDIINVIIPHFKKYALESGKSTDLELWTQCAEILANKEHLSELGLNKIISLKSAINLGLPEDLKLHFKGVKPTVRPEFIASDNPLNPNWVSGFSEGDSSFHLSISSNTNRVRIIYSIGLNNRDLPLILKIQKFFGGIGKISYYAKNNAVQYTVAGNKDINVTLVPHFDTYGFCGNKLPNYLIWREILLLVNSKAHLTTEGLSTIKGLKSNLNQW